MYWAREGKYQQIYVAVGLILSIIAVSVAQSAAYYFWTLRPWSSDKGGKTDALAQEGYFRDGGRMAGDVDVPAVEETGARMKALRALFRRQTPQEALARGTRQARAGEYAQAVKTLSKALKREPYLAKAYLHRGIAYLEMNQVEEALRDLDRAVALMPEEPLAYYNRALAWVALEDWGRAEADLEQAVALAPEDREAWNLLAIVRSQEGKVEAALQANQRSLALEHPAGWRNRAIILEKAGHLEEALVAWEAYGEQGKGDAVYARARRGLLLWGMGREAEAREEVAWAWKRQEKLDPAMRGRLRAVRREMRRKARASSAG